MESSNRETMLVWQFSWTVSWKRWVTHHCWFGPAGNEKLGPCSSSQLHPGLFTLTRSRTWSSKLQLLKKGSGLHSKQSLWAGVLLIAIYLSPCIHHFILPTWSSQKPSHPPGGKDRTGELAGWAPQPIFSTYAMAEVLLKCEWVDEKGHVTNLRSH